MTMIYAKNGIDRLIPFAQNRRAGLAIALLFKGFISDVTDSIVIQYTKILYMPFTRKGHFHLNQPRIFPGRKIRLIKSMKTLTFDLNLKRHENNQNHFV